MNSPRLRHSPRASGSRAGEGRAGEKRAIPRARAAGASEAGRLSSSILKGEATKTKTKTKRRTAAAIYMDLLDCSSIVAANGLRNTSDRIEAAVRDLKRRPAKRRVARASVPMTPAIAAQIRKVARVRPTWPQHRIAAVVGVNPGRVSEVLNGKRRAAR